MAQFAALGYLLVSSDRVAKTGKLTAGLVGLKQAAQLGRLGIVIGVAWLILRLISDVRADAMLIDPQVKLRVDLSIVQGVLFVLFALHIYGACLRGGRVIDFLLPPRPIRLWRLATGPGAWKKTATNRR